jgi:hypothetical protein
MPTEEVNQSTRQEWRDLGFFYDLNTGAREWRILGSADGLLLFANLLGEYAENSNNDRLSAHDHYGPYMYLEIGTSSKAEITDHWIAAPLNDLRHLASLVRERMANAKAGDRLSFRKDFAPESPYDLVLELKEAGFDPASADTLCWAD